MKLDLPKIGMSMMASAPMLLQLGGSKEAWWAGLAFAVVGPLLLGFKSK